MAVTGAVGTDPRAPTQAVSVARMFYDRAAASTDAEAFRHPADGGWTSVTWRQTAETVKVTAAGHSLPGLVGHEAAPDRPDPDASSWTTGPRDGPAPLADLGIRDLEASWPASPPPGAEVLPGG